MSKTTVVVANKLFAVYKTEDVEMAESVGKKIEDVASFKPIVRFGMKKAKAILDHTEELATFVAGE